MQRQKPEDEPLDNLRKLRSILGIKISDSTLSKQLKISTLEAREHILNTDTIKEVTDYDLKNELESRLNDRKVTINGLYDTLNHKIKVIEEEKRGNSRSTHSQQNITDTRNYIAEVNSKLNEIDTKIRDDIETLIREKKHVNQKTTTIEPNIQPVFTFKMDDVVLCKKYKMTSTLGMTISDYFTPLKI